MRTDEFNNFMNAPTGETAVCKKGQVLHGVGEKLQNLRYKAGYSVPRVCELLNELYGMDVSVSTMNSYENDRRSPNVTMFFTLCELYECNNILEQFGVKGKDTDAPVLILENMTVDELVRILYEHYGKQQFAILLKEMVAYMAEEV